LLPGHVDGFELAGLSVVVGGVGAVTAQASSPPTVTTSVLSLLRSGLSADEALERALAQFDREFRERFQVAVVDGAGRAAAYTGQHALEWRGHHVGEGWVAAGNILVSGGVVDAMGEAFVANESLPLAERLVLALDAGVAAGGDRRGHRGAMLRVATGTYVSDVEIRVHEHADPVAELRRLLGAFHSEADIETVAVRAFASLRANLDDGRVSELAGSTVQEAVERLRNVLVEEHAPVDALSAIDDLLGALEDKPDIQMSQFGFALKLLESIAPMAS